MQALGSTGAGKLGQHRGNKCVVVGIPKKTCELDLFAMMAAERTLLGSMAGSCRQDHIDMFVDWFLDGRLDLRTMVTNRFRIEDIRPAVAALGRGEIMGRGLVIL